MTFPVGAFTKLALNGTQFEFISIDPGDSAHHVVDGSDGRITGSRIPDAKNIVNGTEFHYHKILLEPTAEEMAVLLPLLGIPVSSGTTYIIAETVPAFTMIIDRVTKVHTYANSRVDKWILRGQKGLKPWSLELHICSLTDSEGNAGSFSASALSTATGPFAFSMLTYTYDGSQYGTDQFVLAGDNKVLMRYQNAETADDSVAASSDVVLMVTHPYTSTEQGMFTTGAGANRYQGAAGALAFAFVGVSSTWTIGKLVGTNQPPKILAKEKEVRLARFYKAYKYSTSPQLTVVHDSTP